MKKRYSEEQIIAVLKEHEADVSVAELSRCHGFAEGRLYTWKPKYGGVDVSEAKRMWYQTGVNQQSDVFLGK